MRANEFLIEDTEPHKEYYDGLMLSLGSGTNNEIKLTAYDKTGNIELGHVDWKVSGPKKISSYYTHVKKPYRGQGIANKMYNFMKNKGYTIKKSQGLTHAGKQFWNKNRGTEEIWEAANYLVRHKHTKQVIATFSDYDEAMEFLMRMPYDKRDQYVVMNKPVHESKSYIAYSMAKKQADKHGYKVVRGNDGYYTLAQKFDTRPEVIANQQREDLEPTLLAVLKKLQKEKKEFLDIQNKAKAGFLYGVDYDKKTLKEKYKKIRQGIRDVNRQLKSLPSKTVELPGNKHSVLEEIKKALTEDNWSLLESAFDVQILTCPLFNKSLETVNNKIKNRLQEFINFKKNDPNQRFGKSDTPFIGTGPLQQSVRDATLKHAHLSQDDSVVYSVSGKDPTIIKLYGIFKHSDLGTGNTPNLRKQQNMGTKFSQQAFN